MVRTPALSLPHLQPLASTQSLIEIQNLGLPQTYGVTHNLHCGRIPRTNASPTVTIPMWPTQYTARFFPLLFRHWFQCPSIRFQHLQRLWAVSLTGRVTRNPARISPCVYSWSEEHEGRDAGRIPVLTASPKSLPDPSSPHRPWHSNLPYPYPTWYTGFPVQSHEPQWQVSLSLISCQEHLQRLWSLGFD